MAAMVVLAAVIIVLVALDQIAKTANYCGCGFQKFTEVKVLMLEYSAVPLDPELQKEQFMLISSGVSSRSSSG